jgi:hypothetical protein
MKKLVIILAMVIGTAGSIEAEDNPDLSKLKIVLIRHGEKPPIGDNLNCQGLNRALLLPNVIKNKFGVPDFVYVPQMHMGKSTRYSRMFQTVMPLVSKYNLPVNSAHDEMDYDRIAADLRSKSGTVLVVWEHKALPHIAKALGISSKLSWPDEDFDSIWIITFKNWNAVLTKDKEGLEPSADCAF